MIMIDVPMPKCCESCMFGYWSNYYQTSGCTLTDSNQMFERFSRDYLERRSNKCPLIAVKGADDETD